MARHVLPPVRRVGRPPKPPGEKASENLKVTPKAAAELRRVTGRMAKRNPEWKGTQSEAIVRMCELYDSVTGGAA